MKANIAQLSKYLNFLFNLVAEKQKQSKISRNGFLKKRNGIGNSQLEAITEEKLGVGKKVRRKQLLWNAESQLGNRNCSQGFCYANAKRFGICGF